jgi:hypothetical protein
MYTTKAIKSKKFLEKYLGTPFSAIPQDRSIFKKHLVTLS